ncbi:MAG: Maf family protein [Alphaproteobacteria bacterium]
MTLILASSSERRLALLRQLGIVPDAVRAPEIDEVLRDGELPRARALRLARAKVETVRSAWLSENSDGANGEKGRVWILGGDTVVACGRRILDVPEDEEEARFCLSQLSGRRHCVYGGLVVACLSGGTRMDGAWRYGTCRYGSRLVTSAVRFRRLPAGEISAYINSSEWRGCAGGYAIQGRAGGFVSWMSGSYSNIVGLSLSETLALLRGLGWHTGDMG